MDTCSWWAILTARITVRITIRAASHRRGPTPAIISRPRFPERAVRPNALGPGDVRVSRVPATVPPVTGVRYGPPVVRCGYVSSLTSPRVIE